MILGIDVSAVQGAVAWDRVAAAGVRFAYLKCTEGNEPKRNDVRYALHVKASKAVGIYVGAYHFAYPLAKGAGNAPEDQARRAYVTADTLGTQPGELPPALDIEWPPPNQWAKWGVTASSIAAWAKAYLEEAERLWKRTPVLYTYPWFWQSVAETDVEAFARFPLWMARYLNPSDWMPPADRSGAPKPWQKSMLWQFAANNSPIRIPGIAGEVDRNVFLGELDELRRFAGIDPDADTKPALPDDDAPTVHPDVDFPPRDYSDD